MAVRTIREILENPKIRDQIRDQTLTFAVLSQTMGVVTCGKEDWSVLPDRISKY